MKWKDEDMNEADEKIREPGRYLAEVKVVLESKTRTSGDNMWSLLFIEPKSGRELCWDTLSFGRGRGIALKKMTVLGVPKNDQGFFEIEDKDELVGNRCYLNLVEETYSGKSGNSTKLAPDFHSENFGYEPPF